MTKIGSYVLHFHKSDFIYDGAVGHLNQAEIFINSDELDGPKVRAHLDKTIPKVWMKGVRVWTNKDSVRVTCPSWDSLTAIHQELLELEND